MSVLARRRGACPALSAPMATGDGLLVRLVPADGIFAPRALVGLARAAEAFGNGIVEVTARGSLQIRGLSEASVGPLNEAVAALALVPREGLAIDASPLAGIDASEIADARLLAGEIGAAVAAAGLLPRLGPKVSVVIDGGGACPLDASKADVRLQAVRAGDGVAWQVALAGDATRARPFATLGRQETVAAVVALLARIAALGRGARMDDVLRADEPHHMAQGAESAAQEPQSPPTSGRGSSAELGERDLSARSAVVPETAGAKGASSDSPQPLPSQEPQSSLSRVRGRAGEGESGLDTVPQSVSMRANADGDAVVDVIPPPPQNLSSPPPQNLSPPPPPQPSPASGRGGTLALGERDLSTLPEPSPASGRGSTVVNGESDLSARPAPPRPAPKTRPGPLQLHPLADGTFARGIGLPFGALEAETFIALIEAAEQAGAREIRLAPGRALLAIGLTQDGAARLERAAAALGLLTDPADPRGFVAACPGAPACASGLLPARALAPLVAHALAPLLDGSFEVHVSGCAKGCAHPAPAAVTLVGREAAPTPLAALPSDVPVGHLPAVDFPIALVRDGTAYDTAAVALTEADLIPTLTRLAAPGRQPGESGAQALSRLLAQAFMERSA